MTALAEGQIRWRDRLLFDGRDLALIELQGWDDLPEVDTGNVERPSRHGTWPGRALAGQRLVTATGVLTGARDLQTMSDVLAPLRRALALAEDARQRPLTIRVGGQTLTAYGQVSARSIPGGVGYQAARPTVVVQWTCPDPRRYGRGRSTVITAPQRSGEGLEYPLEYPLDYGEPAQGGSAFLINGGDTPTHPIVTITGPCTRPRLINRTTGRALEFRLTLAETETLVIDCDQGTVTVDSNDGFHTLGTASVPPEHWTLEPGSNPVHFRPETSEHGASATVVWNDAYL